MTKTYKREVALGLTGVYLSLFAHTLLFTPDPVLLTAKSTLMGVIALPVFLFLGAAYGMDWVNKQTTWGSTPYNEQDDYNAYENEYER